MQRSPWLALALAALTGPCVTSCRMKTKSSSAPAAASSTDTAPQHVAISGTVALDTDVAAADADGLTPGGPVPGATVFLQGAPETAVKADAKGAFTIDLDLSATSQSLADPGAYELVVWYTTQAAQHRFGVLKTGTASGSDISLGDVALSYTRKASFTLTDRTGTPIPNYADGQTCSVTFPGFEGKITVTAADGALTGTYIPPATYSVQATCTGYQPTTSTVVITPVSNFTDVQAVSLMLAPQ